MTKKLSFNDLPAAVEKILEILTSEQSGHATLPELVQKITLLEKKIEYLQTIVSPDKPLMDMQTVCRVLKLKPKAVYELAQAGVLPSREQGRRTVFYEEGVVKYYATQPAWKEVAAIPKPAPAPAEIPANVPATGRQRIDINVAVGILDRSAAAIYQLASNNRVPHHKDGRTIYFFSDELREWVKDNPPRKRKQR